MANIEIFGLVKDKMEVYVNLRIEKHGDNNENGYDVKCKGRFSNSILLKFDAGLRDALYMDDEQRDVEDFKKKLRFPRIAKPIAWELEVPRTILRLHDADNPAEDLILSDAKTDSFVFEPMEGGTVELSFRVKLKDTSEEQVLKLLRANGQTIPISLECAALEEKADNFEQAELLTQEPMSDARANAESMFDKPGTDMALKPDDVVDADFEEVPPAAATNVQPITKAKRGGGRKAAGAAIE
jgi:hypothetical protein